MLTQIRHNDGMSFLGGCEVAKVKFFSQMSHMSMIRFCVSGTSLRKADSTESMIGG